MPSPIPAESIGKSQEFFSNTGNYGPLALTYDFRSIVDCIEPRDRLGVPQGQHVITMQTPGGGPGEANDAANALTVIEKRLVTIEEAMESDRRHRPQTVFWAHPGCAFLKNLIAVNREMANPSDFTLEGFYRWAAHIGQLEHAKSTLWQSREGAAYQADYLEGQVEVEGILQHADELFPDHDTVRDVKGENTSRVYVVNLHPRIGKDRNKKPADPDEAQQIQAYHDTPAATVENLRTENAIPNEVRGVRVTNMLLRSAAARTIITAAAFEEFTFLEVEAIPDAPGIKIVEKTFSAA